VAVRELCGCRNSRIPATTIAKKQIRWRIAALRRIGALRSAEVRRACWYAVVQTNKKRLNHCPLPFYKLRIYQSTSNLFGPRPSYAVFPVAQIFAVPCRNIGSLLSRPRGSNRKHRFRLVARFVLLKSAVKDKD
jgi:hypothetical protein